MSKQTEKIASIRYTLAELYCEMENGMVDKEALNDAVDAQVWLNRIVFMLNHANGYGKRKDGDDDE